MRFTCCGKTCCLGCDKNVMKSTMPHDLKNRCHQCRKPFPKNDEKQIEQLREWVAKDKAWAQYMMGSWYRDGKNGLKRSYVMARMLFEKAVAQGDPGAMSDLARLYGTGRGVVQSNKKAVELYTMAVEKGDGGAMFNLGNKYRDGQGVVQSYKKAAELFTMAAEQGVADAMNNLGILYFQGQGVAYSNELAREWITKAADKGNEDAFKALKILDDYEGKLTTTASTTTATSPSVCCSSCNKPQPSGHTFRKCTGCRTVQYCNKECQRAHWSPGGHKQECKRRND
jgi:TPR repeat protein